ncbi:ABC transporter permease [Pseudaminobacter sp. NGMCC 1.201702]|uniref:ABC transporter permease n=1 Tax=Pseudaminobacter sp. NGMCC 1.201702 TaxID=3391825 RepID=UPI0039F13C2B
MSLNNVAVDPAATARDPGNRLINWSRSEFLLAPSLVYYFVFLILPSVTFCAVSFYGMSSSGFHDGVFTLNNYLATLRDEFYLSSLWLTLSISLQTTAFCLLLGYPPAYWLSRRSPSARKKLIILLLFPLLLSTVVRVYGWIALLGSRGIANQLLISWGITEHPLPLLYSEATVLIGLTSILLPYMIINITNTLITIDPVLREAAAAHGASPVRVFLNVTLPLSRAGIVSGAVIVFTIAMSTYIISFLLGGPRVKLLGNLIFDATSSFNWPSAAALSVILVLATTACCGTLMQILGRNS